jgi:tRNA pseudouridine38-40 synthase
MARLGVWSQHATWEPRELDSARMQRAAQHLVGEHDFSSYRARGCQAKHPVRTIEQIEVNRCGDFVIITVTANAFLQHMVRNIAGVLISIGSGRASQDWSLEVLQARDRSLGGVTAPPQGLYLMAIDYPAEFGLPKSVRQALVMASG